MKKILPSIIFISILCGCNPKTEDGMEIAKIKIEHETFNIPIPYILHVDDRRNKRLSFISLMVKTPDLEIISNMDYYIQSTNRTPDMMTFGFAKINQTSKSLTESLEWYAESSKNYTDGVKVPDFTKENGLVRLGNYRKEHNVRGIYTFINDGKIIANISCAEDDKYKPKYCRSAENFNKNIRFSATFNRKYLDWYFDEGRTKLLTIVNKWHQK